ncbi:MAG: glycoside hydrolase domain-containing protein [Planctomycetota bacterium]
MKRMLLSALPVLLALLPEAFAAAIPDGKLGRFIVPRMTKSPVLDGKIDPDEWKEAVAISGLAQQNPGGNWLIMRPTTYFIGWDPGHVYIACRTWIMPGYKPRVGGRAPGAVTAFDDGMEFNVKPMGKNVPAGRADSSYKFFISCMGSDGDLARVSVGQLFRNWQPHIQAATHLSEPGSAPLGGRWWEGEVVLSTEDFELSGPNQAGDVWRMLLAFNHIPGWMQAAIPINTGYFDANGFPEFILADSAPGVHVSMDELPGPLDGTAAAQFSVFNPAAQPAQVSVLAQYCEAREKAGTKEMELNEMLKKEQTLTVEPGKSAAFKVSEKLPRDLGKGTGGIFYRVSQGDKELFRYFVWFKLGYEERWVKYTPPQAAFPLSGSFNPARNNFLLQADTYYLDNPALAKSLHFRVGREGGLPVTEGDIKGTVYCYFSTLLQFPELEGGEYQVEATMQLDGGKELGPVKTSFKKLDEAKVFSAWWKNKLGDTERVIPPFEPLKKKGSTVSVWGRSYTLDALGLPREIVSQGQAVSAAPARFVVTIGGKELAIIADEDVSFDEKKEWRHSFKGKVKAKEAGLVFTSTGSVEQDGLVLLHVTFAPAEKEAVTLDALRLEFPVAGDTAECLLCGGPGGNFASLSHLILPADKPGRLWCTLDTGKGGSMMNVGSFYPDVWLGNERRGLLWWGDSDQGWVPDDDVPAHEVLREGTTVVLRNNIIGKPFKLTGPRTITFSYMASPFRPLVKGWRMAIHSEDGTFDGPHKKGKDPKTGQSIDGWCWLNPPSYDPAEWGTLWAQFKQEADAKVKREQPFNPAQARNRNYVHTSVPLVGWGPLTCDPVAPGYFAPEWAENTFSPSQRDFLIGLCGRAFAEGGLRTIYWDIFYIHCSKNEQNGTAYRLPDGRLQPTYQGFNLRQYMMRLYALMYDHGLTPGSNVSHATNSFPLAAFPWMDAVLDGEWAEITDATPRDWVDFYPVQRMRPMALAENFGTLISWMSLFHVSDKEREKKLFRGFMDYQRLHDTWTGQDGRFPPQAVLDFGLNDERLQYVPYWRNKELLSDDKDLLVSQWRLPGRVLLLVFNNNREQTKEAQFKLDFDALGLGKPEQCSISELGGCGDPAVLLNSQARLLAVPGLLPHTGRYIGLRTEREEDLKRVLAAFGTVAAHVNAQNRLSGANPVELLDWGLVSPQTEWLGFQAVHEVACSDAEVEIAAWRQPDRVLLVVANMNAAKAKDVKLDIDLGALGLVPKLPWQEFVRVRTFAPEKTPPATLDFYERKLNIPKLEPKTVRLVGVRLY